MRLDVVEQVVSCTNCELHQVGNGPVPFSGPREDPNGIAILGEAPGRQEDAAGQPFIGPAGQLLRKHLVEAGITPERCFIINTVSCWPNGTPTPEHVEACSGNKAAQLALADPKWVLVLGKVAMQAVRPSLRIASARGKPFRPEDGPVHLITYHPAAALRKGTYEKAMRSDIELFLEICRAGQERWTEFLVNRCWECDTEDPEWFDVDGIAWCEKHAPKEYLKRMELVHEQYRQAKENIDGGPGVHEGAGVGSSGEAGRVWIRHT